MLDNYCVFAAAVTVLSVLFLFLSIRVIRFRRKLQVPYSQHSNDPRFLAAVSAQRNFVDYTPFTLVLMLTICRLNANLYVYATFVTLFVIGRLCHTFSVLKCEHKAKPSFTCRKIGMVLTFVSIAAFVVMLWLYAHSK